MRRWIFAFVVLTLIAFGLPSCGGDDDDDNDTSSIDDDASDDDTDDDTSDDDTGDDDDSTDDDDTSDDDTADDDTTDDDTDDGLKVEALLEGTASILPNGVESCAVIAQTQCVGGVLKECAIYDTGEGEFADDPPAWLERIYYLDRYHDLYYQSENSGLNFETITGIEPGADEAVWSDPANFDEHQDWGDGAFYMGYQLMAASLRYAVTGTDADYARMVATLEKQLNNWRVTGVPGYMVRATAAMLDQGVSIPPHHPEYNLRTYKERSNHVIYTVDPARYELIPDYYHEGVTIDETPYNTTPMMEGSPSLDAYSGALMGQQMAFDLLREEDSALADEIAQNVTCFLKRHKKLRITNLTDSPLGRAAVQYLTNASAFHPDPDDIDLSEVGTLIGYVQEAIPPPDADTGSFIEGCPDTLPTEVDPDYDLDASAKGFLGKLLALGNRLAGNGDAPIDFIYFVSHRGGDVGFLLNYALFAYHATGDQQYLDWIDSALVDEIDGLAVLNTAGSFYLPIFCNSWIGGDLIHPILYAALARVDDDALAPALRRTLLEEFKNKLFATDNNAYFGLTYGAVMDASVDPLVGDYVDWAVEELSGYIQHPDHPLDPKRKYSTDFITNPLPGYEPEGPTQDEIDACEAGIELGPIEIPGPGVDPDFEVVSRAPLPVGKRVPHDLIWHFSPHNLKRDYGSNEGRGHLMFTDLTVPFWLGRYYDFIDDGQGTALAWRATGASCDTGVAP
ncbi:MAG: hypothetical protein H6684_05810 [Deltaproteobacteria bacterium]|nr:hypothetical protein [Deltaproteobacteria bacterium]MCB9488227.1 hypothetical protein [Deltaproteobacteria bacterium]